MTLRLPTGCRFWIRSGTTDRRSSSSSSPRRGGRSSTTPAGVDDSEPTTYRLALPYVVFVVSTIGDQIEAVHVLPDAADRVARRDALLVHPAEHERRRRRLSRIGPGERASVGERVDALIGAFWASRFNQDLRRHPLPFSGGFRAWASRSRRDPLAALSCSTTPTGGPSARSSRRWPGWRSQICRPGHAPGRTGRTPTF